MSFFDLPAAAIDREALDTFLGERLPESLNIDYKRELSDSTYETIAAMANTYGGVILIGVDEDPDEPTRPLLPPIGVDPEARERLINQSYTRLQPPFAPDVVPVPVDATKVVLVIRVDPLRADRPIVVSRRDDHKIPIRLEARNAPADRYRIAQLFAESAAAVPSLEEASELSIGRVGTYPLDDRSRPALFARVAVESRLPPERLDSVVIDTETRGALGAALESSPLAGWLSVEALKLNGVVSASSWKVTDEGFSNLSYKATLRQTSWYDDLGVQTPYVGQASLLLPASRRSIAGRVSLLLDVAYDPDTFVASSNLLTSRPLLGLEDIYRLLRALLDTALDVAAPVTFERILGVPAWERIGPFCQLYSPQVQDAQTAYGIGNFLQTRDYLGRAPFLGLQEASFFVPRRLDVESDEGRREVVVGWLMQLFLDIGLERFEDELRGLA